MTGEQRRIILKALTDKIESLPSVGYVLPTPMRFTDKADFWATVNPKITQKDIETSAIAYVQISRLNFADENPIEIGCFDNPLTEYDYNFRIFREFFSSRLNESDAFLKKVNASYELFLDSIDDLKQEFQGLQEITGLPNNWTVETNSLTQDEFVQEFTESLEVPNVFGFTVDLQCKVEILIGE